MEEISRWALVIIPVFVAIKEAKNAWNIVAKILNRVWRFLKRNFLLVEEWALLKHIEDKKENTP